MRGSWGLAWCSSGRALGREAAVREQKDSHKLTRPHSLCLHFNIQVSEVEEKGAAPLPLRDLPSKTELSSGSRLNQGGPVTDKRSDSAHVPCSDGTASTPSCAGRYDMCYHQ
ncbi:hypothetical protein AOLI_G00323050 [Acnodon oligacanthus]